jgi:hypothetical protein
MMRTSLSRSAACATTGWSLLRDHFAHGGAIDLAVSTEAAVHLDGELQALDLTRKASRLLAESAALVHARATDDAEVVNLG